MSDAPAWQQQLDALTRQYLSTWSQLGGQGAPVGWPGAAAATPAWQAGAAAVPGLQEALARLGQPLQGYLALMQGVAERSANGADPAALTAAWREAVAAASAGNPVLEALSSITGDGARSVRQLSESAESLLAPLQSQYNALLGMPAFGAGREHQQRMQELAREQAALQQASNRYAALLLEASEKAFAVFERKLAGHSAPGKQLESARALYDLWIDAAEEAYAEVALSPRFGEVFGELVNAQMRVRRGVQQQVERACSEVGMPTRREIDAAHRRSVDLQRALATLQARVQELEQGGADAGPTQSSTRQRPARAAAGTRTTPTTRGKASADKQGAAKAGASKAGAAKAGTAKASAGKAGAAKAGTAKTGAGKAGAAKAGTAKAGAARTAARGGNRKKKESK